MTPSDQFTGGNSKHDLPCRVSIWPRKDRQTEVTLVLADLNVLGTGSRCPLHEKWAPDVCTVNREYSRVMIADMHAHKCNDLDIIYSLPANDTLSTYKLVLQRRLFFDLCTFVGKPSKSFEPFALM